MNLLGAKLYDPAAAVSKATSALLAMTAVDTTNLRLAITVPAHGMVRFKMRAVVVGATTTPTLLFGVLNGATVIGRAMPQYENATANAATQGFVCDAEFTVTGLTPGAMNVDAAYAVQVVVASTNIKYGGPNTNAGANAWGGFLFEAWDPQPQSANTTLLVDSSGRVDVSKVAGTAQTARDLGAQLDAAVSTRAPSSTALSNAVYTNARAANLDNLDAAVTTRLSSAGYTAPDNAGIATLGTRLTAGRATNLDNLDAAVTTRAPSSTALSNVDYTAARAGKLDNLDAAVSTRLAGSGYTAPLDAAGTRSAIGLAAGNLDTQLSGISSRTTNLPPDPADASDIAGAFGTVNSTLAAIVGYIDTEVGAIKAKTDNLPASPASSGDVATVGTAVAAVSSTLGVPAGASVSADVAAVKADTAAVKAKTDQLAFSGAALNANVAAINGTAVAGTGGATDKWRPGP